MRFKDSSAWRQNASLIYLTKYSSRNEDIVQKKCVSSSNFGSHVASNDRSKCTTKRPQALCQR